MKSYTLRELLRQDFWKIIRPNFIKEKCEYCGESEILHLHHVDRFHNLLMETLEELQLNELDTKDYTEFELKCIRNFMIAKQVNIKYKTLCDKCHKRIHLLESKKDEYSDFYYNPYGQYTYVNVDNLNRLNIGEQYKFIFIYLSTYMKFNCDKLVLKQENGFYKEIKESEIYIMLNASKKEYNVIKNIFIKNNLINIEKDKTVTINKEYAFKGFLNKSKNINYIKIFNFKELYDKLQFRENKLAYRIINIIIYFKCNYFEFKSKTHLSKILNVSVPTIINLFDKYSEMIKIKDGVFYINPKYFYFGELDNNLKKLHKIFI